MKTDKETYRYAASNDGRFDEAAIRSAWAASRPEPSENSMQHLRQNIATQAALHAVSTQKQPIYFWRPALATAAALVLLLGAYTLWQQMHPVDSVWQQVTTMEDEIHAELDALETTVWDALAELEAESPSNDILLDAIALQMALWED